MMDRNNRGGRKPRRKVCAFCVDKVENIDYKTLGKYSRKVLSMRNHLRLAASGQVEAAKIQARAPSKFPENYRDGPVFATYGANLARAITEGYKTTQTSGSADGNGSA